MASNEIEANLELGLDWVNALRNGAADSIAERFDSAVEWVAVSGETACTGRAEGLDWLRTSGARAHRVVALEFVASDSHLVLGIADPTLAELAGVKLDGRLYVLFAIRDGRITQIRDHADRAAAFADAGLPDYSWH